MAETLSSQSNKKKLIFKALKATIKAVIFYAIYFLLSSLLAPLSQAVPGLQETLDAFITIYIVLMIIGDMTSGTIYQHFFNAAKSLFVIGYMLLTLNGGIVGLNVESISLLVDLRLLLEIVVILGLLGFSKSVLQAINFMNQKAELQQVYS